MSNEARANPAFALDLSAVLEAADGVGLREHVLFQTSGSEGPPKWVALSRAALVVSAEMVIGRLEVGESDRWLRVLGDWHVGGYGIGLRASLSGASVCDLGGKWSADACLRALDGATLLSLVPTQVFDLIRAGARPPRTLRAVMVGGATLSAELRGRAEALGWPLFDAYGMTEAGSTVALDGELLPGWEARTGDAGELELRGAALFSGYLTGAADGWQWRQPFDSDGWFSTADRAAVDGRKVMVRGRLGDVVKVLGEAVDLGTLGALLEGIGGDGCALAAIPDARRGRRLVLAVAAGSDVDADSVIGRYNARVAGFERVDGALRVAAIPRTATGKVRRGELAQMLENSSPA